MTDVATRSDTTQIEVDEVFPHAPDVIWRTLTTAEMVGRWLMKPEGFAPVVGTHFTMQTKAGGAWDGVIHCRVLEVVPNERFAFAWASGDESNVGYGSKLDTVVTWALSKVDGGTRVRMVHSGFVLPRNETAFTGMSEGWSGVVKKIDALSREISG